MSSSEDYLDIDSYSTLTITSGDEKERPLFLYQHRKMHNKLNSLDGNVLCLEETNVITQVSTVLKTNSTELKNDSQQAYHGSYLALEALKDVKPIDYTNNQQAESIHKSMLEASNALNKSF